MPPRYRAVREIGRGSSAAVYVARDTEVERDVVVKLLHTVASSQTGTERFRRETRRIGQLLHAGLPPLLDAGETNGRHYLISPFVAGETLRQRLSRTKQLTVVESVAIARQIAVVLGYLHSEGVIHRDLKPENVYLTTRNQVLVLDFGLAKLLEPPDSSEPSLTADGASVGTPQYMSPEQVGGESRLDQRADLYALGCLLYEMLAGEPPFTAATRQAVMRMHLVQPPRALKVFRPGLPDALERIVLRLLAKTPADRFDDAASLCAALDAVSAHEPELVRRSPRRSRIWAFVVAAAAVTAAISWLVFVFPTRSQRVPPSVPRQRVAVLPFDDGTPSGHLGWLALGITRDIADALSGVSVLDVVTPEAIDRVPGEVISVDSIARLLGARIVVSGSLDSIGSSLVATIRVRDARLTMPVGTPFRLVSKRDSTDHLRTAVVDSIAAILRLQLGRHFELVTRPRGTRSASALEHVRRARTMRDQAMQQMGVDDAATEKLIAQTDSLLIAASRADGSWSEPLLMRGWLADLRALRVMDRNNNECIPECRRWVDEAARIGKQILGRHAESAQALTLVAAARIRGWDSRQGAEALAALDSTVADVRSVLASNPSDARALMILSRALRMRGDFRESAEVIARAIEADPWLVDLRSNFRMQYFAYLREGKVAEASQLCGQGQRLHPEERGFRECRLSLLGWYGRGGSAVDSAWAALGLAEAPPQPAVMRETWSYRRAMVAAVIARTGLRDSAKAVFAGVLKDPRANHGNIDFELAFVLLNAGDTAGSIAALGRFIANRPQRKTYVGEHVWFRGLRNVEAFRSLVADAR